MSKVKLRYNALGWQKNPVLIRYGMIVFSIILICILLPKQPRFQYEFEKGKVWDHENLVSPYTFAVLKTQEEINKDREQILKTVKPIYNLVGTAEKEQIDQFNSDLGEKWQTAQLDTLEQDIEDYRQVGDELLKQIYTKGVIALNNRYQNKGQNESSDETSSHYNFTLVAENLAQQKNTVDCFTIETSNEFILDRLENNRKIQEKEWLAEVLKNYITINYSFNEILTEKNEQNALAHISTTRGIVEKGELIVEKDKVINSEVYQKLESLRKVFEDEARLSGKQGYMIVGQGLVITLVLALHFTFLFLFRRDIFYNNRLILIILAVIIGMLGVLSWAVKAKIPSLYYIPYCSVPIIFRVLFDTRVAINIHLMMVLVAALFVPNSFEFVFLQFLTGMVAIYSIKTLIKREQFLISSLIILAAYIIAYLGLVLSRNGTLNNVYWVDILPFFVSVGLTLLAYPLIYAFEKLFGIVSDLTLMELANSNSKLLRELSLKAPGTFQHSLQVANLAEAAIYKIGGNPLLVRAGALYHDIGKIANPLFFIENQKTGHNPHEELTPEQSAQIIISHVHKGVEITRKHQLPEPVIDFVKTHHGTTKVDYFYNIAVRDNPDKLIDESIFKYPGPLPYTKEMAVLMIADSVEAASRALDKPTEESINKLVDGIIEHKLMQKQFIEADITMRDIQEAADIFKMMLKSIYHVRIDYEKSKAPKKSS